MKLFGLIGGLLNFVYFLAMLFGFVLILFLFLLVFPPYVGIIVALVVSASIVLGVRNFIRDERAREAGTYTKH